MKVRILGVACSPRHGNTEVLVKEALRAAEELADTETDFITLAGKKIEPCDSCYKCFGAKAKEPCPPYDDDFNSLVPHFAAADGFIMGVPVYYGDVTAQFAALRDRLMVFEVSQLGPLGLRNKPVGAVTVAYDRQGGQESVCMSLARWALTTDMVVVSVGPERPVDFGIGGYYGCMATECWHPNAPNPKVWGEKMNSKEELEIINKDKAGMFAARCIGWRVTELAKVIKVGFQKLPENERHWPPGAAGGYTTL